MTLETLFLKLWAQHYESTDGPTLRALAKFTLWRLRDGSNVNIITLGEEKTRNLITRAILL